jgi:hypothetical protein
MERRMARMITVTAFALAMPGIFHPVPKHQRLAPLEHSISETARLPWLVSGQNLHRDRGLCPSCRGANATANCAG